MPDLTPSDSFATVEDAIQDLKASAKQGEVTALLKAQVHLAFGDFEKAAETVQKYFDANPAIQEKVKPELKALLDSIKTSKGLDESLLSQFSALGIAAGTNPCGICVPPIGGTGLWTINPVTRKKVCTPCVI